MRRIVHFCIGALFFLGYAYVLVEFRPVPAGYLLFGLIATIGGAALPDILEAPVDAKHRRFFHSKRMLKCSVAIFAGCVLVTILPGFSGFEKELVFAFSCLFLGYISHLLADSTTHRGLPE